ncbi:hypothetical protein [Streptomyces sp. NPDC048361]|uniref:hypothetical protein n=1 Tax=Streptomyces sp. NPDC048361 TaxID=3154720 RepID=UPI0034372ECF
MLSDQDCSVCAGLRREAEANRADVGDLLLRVQIHELGAHRDQHIRRRAGSDRAPLAYDGSLAR